MSAECLISAKVEFGATVLINSAVALFLLRFFCDVELRGGHWPVAAGSMAELVLRPVCRPQFVEFDC